MKKSVFNAAARFGASMSVVALLMSGNAAFAQDVERSAEHRTH